jgi:hypothetical protein
VQSSSSSTAACQACLASCQSQPFMPLWDCIARSPWCGGCGGPQR